MKNKIFFLIVLSYTLIGLSQSWVETQKIVAPDREQNGRFGENVGIYENFAIVGTPWHSENNTNLSGSAYIYERNSENQWELVQILLPQNIQEGDNFGYSVDIYEDYAAISSRQFLFGDGAVYIYKRDNQGIWNEIQYIEEPDNLNQLGHFGLKVSLSETNLAVSNESFPGQVYIFERDNNDLYNNVQLIQGSDTENNDNFGWAVSLKGNTLIVGAKSESAGNTSGQEGAVYVFQKNANGVWNEVQKLTPTNRIEFSNFGLSLSINNLEDIILVGSPSANYNSSAINQGVVYVFYKNSNDLWYEEQILTASDFDSFKNFGSSVAIENNTLLVGAENEDHEISPGFFAFDTGSIYSFLIDQNNLWFEVEKLTPSDFNQGANLGHSIDIHGDTFISGARYENWDENDSNSILNAGAAYFFQDANSLNVKNYYKNDYVKLYPSPTNGYVNLEFKKTVKKGKVILRNNLGQQIQSADFYNTNKFSLNIRNTSGIYILEVFINDVNREVIRIIKY